MKPLPKRQRQTLLILLGCSIAVITVLVFYQQIAAPYSQKRFKETWVNLFRDNPTQEALRSLPEKYRPDLIFIRNFPDGNWVAARSESAHEKFFDMTIFADSKHFVHSTQHHFCNFQSVVYVLSEPKAASLPQFYQELETMKIDLQLIP